MQTMKPFAWFHPDPKQPRKFADPAEIDLLSADIAARGILVPLLAQVDGMIIDGWRRFLAAQKLALKEMPVIVIDKPLSDKELRGIQLATVFHKADLTAAEKWESAAELMCMNPEWEQKDLAKFLNITDGRVTRILSPSKCTIRWQEALKTGNVDLSKCYTASKLASEAEQDALLAFMLNSEKDGKKVSRDDLERERKRRNGQAPAVRVGKIKCPVSSGATVQISGENSSLDEAIEAAQEWVKEANKASDQGLDAKTFERVCRDKNKKG